MNRKVVLNNPLFVFSEDNKISAPQKCKLPQNLATFPATSLIIVKSGSKRFLCKLFYLNECFNSKSVAYMDNSVELIGDYRTTSEIRQIEEIEHVQRNLVTRFTKAKVTLFIDSKELNLNIIRTIEDMKKVTRSILRHYQFTANSSITCERHGIKRIFVRTTSNAEQFGSLDEEAELDIGDILVEPSSQRIVELGGLKNPENDLSSLILKNLQYKKHPEKFPIRPQCQTLIHGPIGCGKTSLVHHMSNKFKCNLFEITGDIFKAYPGETEEVLQKLFDRIKKISTLISTNVSIVLVENIEIFCPKTDNKLKENSHSSRIASLIYSYLDEISNHTKGIVIIGTTSKIDLVNIALRRLNRLGIEIALDMPDESQRCEITKILVNRMLTSRMNIENVEELSRYVAVNTTGFVGADLEILCQYVLRQYEAVKKDVKQLFDCGFQRINPSVMRDNLGHITRSTMTLRDIAGMDDIKKSLLTSILGPLRNPEKFQKFGLNSPSGILLYGPSGCAKTTIVKCLAGETKMTLISVSSAEIYSPYVGEAEKFIVRLFNQARQSAPAILFFDEIDTIVGSRNKSNGTSDANMRILSTLLTEIDGFGGDNGNTVNNSKPILVIGATNRPECIDDALMRPGRFDKLIHVSAPDHDYRLQILKFLLKDMPVTDVDVKEIAKRTDLFSGADLGNLVNEAAMCAATRDINCDKILAEDFENVLCFLRPSLSDERIQFYKDFEARQVRGH